MTVLEAFEIWYSLRDTKKQREIAKEIGIHQNTLTNWIKQNNWIEQAQQRDVEVKKAITRAVTGSIASETVRNVKFLQRMIHDFQDKYDAGEIRYNSVKDFATIIDKLNDLMKMSAGMTEDSDFDTMTDAELREYINSQKDNRSRYEQRIIDNFAKFEPNEIDSGSQDSIASYQEAQREQARTLHSKGQKPIDVPSIDRENTLPIWRKSNGKINDRGDGSSIPLHGIISRMVSNG